MKIVITGGGTGGHIYPALAVARALQERGHRVLWIGSRSGLEAEIVPQADFEFHGIFCGKLRRYFSWQNFSDFFRIIYGYLQAKHTLKRWHPDAIFSKGGFVAVPVALAARQLNIPILTHESDTTPGLATRLIMRFGHAQLCANFPSLQKFYPEARVVGIPVAERFFDPDPDHALRELQLDPGLPLLVIIGGSQGALGLNQLVWGALPELLPQTQIVHQVGTFSLPEAKKQFSALPPSLQKNYHFYPTLKNSLLADTLAAADLVLSRAGATALSELAAVSAPAFLVPLPTTGSRGDQLDNARFFEKRGATLTCPQAKLTPAKLSKELKRLLRDDAQREKLRENITELARPDATSQLVDLIEGLSRN